MPGNEPEQTMKLMNFKWKNRSIRVSLFFLFIVFGIMIGAAFFLIIANNTIGNLKAQVRQAVVLETDLVNTKVNDYFSKIRQSIEYLSGNRLLYRERLSERDVKLITGRLEAVRSAYGFMFVYYGRKDRPQAINYPSPKGYDARKRDWFTGAEKKGHLHVSEPYSDAATGEQVSTVSLPLYNDGRIVGVLAVDVSLKDIVDIVFEESDLFSSTVNMILSDEGRVLITGNSKYHDRTYDFPALRKAQEASSLIFSAKDRIGAVRKSAETSFYIVSSVNRMEIYRPAIIALMQITAAIVVILSLFIYIMNRILARLVVSPIIEISKDMGKIKSLDFDGKLNLDCRCLEISVINESLDNMKKGLKSFGKYVPTDLVDQLMQQSSEAVLGAERKMLTLFFTDIADFTSISEKLGPEDLSDRMSAYLGNMTNILQMCNGTVDKYVGDAIMCFWGAPMEESQHAYLACRAALECQVFLAQFNGSATDIPFITRIGINTGEAIVGNFGFERRMSYTALGDTVNCASRIEGLNKYYGTSILVSEATKSLTEEFFVFRTLDRVVVKGKSTGVKIYELVGYKGGLSPQHQAIIDGFNEAMEAYYNRDWEGCYRILSGIRGRESSDRPLEIMLKRSAGLIKNPPSKNFVGTVYMRGK